MTCNSDNVWRKTNKYLLENYHIRQYNEQYESVKFIVNHIKNLVDTNVNSICDLGCGADSLCYWLNKNINNLNYTGIDICEETLNIAILYNKDSKFIKMRFQDCNDLLNNIVISNQTLLIISPELADEFIIKHFTLSNRYVIIFSLFTDSDLEIHTKINDPYNNEIVYYNIFPISKINQIAENFGFKLLINEPFYINKKLDKPERSGRGTYTIETINNELLQFSDVLYMPWKIIIYEKK